jgi:hypothetical protein
VRRLLIAPAILLMMSAGFIARTSPAHAQPPGTIIATAVVNWHCNVGFGDSFPIIDTDAGPFEFGLITDSWHANGRDFTFLYNCPVTLTAGSHGVFGGPDAGTLLGTGRAYGVGTISAGGGFHTTAHVSIVGTLNGIWFDSFSWNQYMVEGAVIFSGIYGIAQNCQITSFVGSWTGLRGTGLVLSDYQYYFFSTDGRNEVEFQLGFG